MVVLDTHALLWMDADDAALGKAARRAIGEAWAHGQVGVSAISFWECAMLHQAGRIELPCAPDEWRRQWLAAGLKEWPLSGDIVLLAVSLDLPHKDPADRFIVATAIARGAALLTADKLLLGWKNALVRRHAGR
jgi:PIN domain nuclease of toxin-antitoxin system